MIETPDSHGVSFWHAIAASAGALLMKAFDAARSVRKVRAEAANVETETALSVSREWRELYEEQKARADELQTRLTALERDFYRERKQLNETIETLASRIRELERKEAANGPR